MPAVAPTTETAYLDSEDLRKPFMDHPFGQVEPGFDVRGAQVVRQHLQRDDGNLDLGARPLPVAPRPVHSRGIGNGARDLEENFDSCRGPDDLATRERVRCRRRLRSVATASDPGVLIEVMRRPVKKP